MSRTARLLELLICVQSRRAFTAQALADEFGVSRRTMLRDLNALSAMGVTLRATPGPGGGYELPWSSRRLSLSLTPDEALALITAYESLQRYPVSPFAVEHLSAVTKLRSALPPDVVEQLDRVRQHVALLDPVYALNAPLVGALLDAAIKQVHLDIAYDSMRSGVTNRRIFPFGIYAASGA